MSRATARRRKAVLWLLYTCLIGVFFGDSFLDLAATASRPVLFACGAACGVWFSRVAVSIWTAQ